jgi:L-cysteine:1D-myo-inositol 2-amino-2-deoxy-alpha-D-glucopyranoside ligase
MYVCGITPYDATHMGHANTYVTFDLLNRIWRDHGLNVLYTQNVTDVDDPLLERAAQTGVDWRELAADQVRLFREDMEALNVIPPDCFVGAVESIGLVIDLIDELEQRGAIYAVDDPDHPDLYFRRKSDDEFGSLAHLDADESLAVFAERGGDPDRPGKKDPLDALVWMAERPGEPSWDSPFGKGRPGWHIECAAIALKNLGGAFAVQGGGSDLIFPHHEMCAAEARVATGRRFAHAYVHSGMVGLDGEKMSKSLGNLVLVSKLREQGVDPMAIRLALLSNRYRDDWSWTDELLASAEQQLDRWREAVRLEAGLSAADVISGVRTALNDDLDAPAALAAIDAWASGSLAVDGDDAEAGSQIIDVADALLGIRL